VRRVSVVTEVPSEPTEPSPGGPDSGERRGFRLRAWRPHLTVAAIALAMAVWVTCGLWRDPFNAVLDENKGDTAWFEWLLGYGVYTLSHGANPFYTWMMNTPDGVNLAANTSVTVYTTLFAPLTWLAGPQISFVTILTLNLAVAAYAWWLFLRRFLVRSELAAAVGGLFAGFAPGFISHANGHLNWSAGWVAPLLLWGVLRLRQKGRWLRNGLVLGLLVAVGFSIATEGLFYIAMASGIFLAVWSLHPATRAEARAALGTVLAGLGVTAVVAGIVLAYPLYMHFAGPRTFIGTGFNQEFYAEDVISYLWYPDRSIAGWLGFGTTISPNPTEETSYFGLPLVVLVIVALAVLRRRSEPGRRATLAGLGTVAVVFVVLSLGPVLKVVNTYTSVKLPYEWLRDLPLFDSALPARLALVVAGVFAVVIALMVDDLLTREQSTRAHTIWAGALAFALVPIFPIPLETASRAAEPAFFANGTWKQYVSDHGVLTALPFATTDMPDGQRWQAYAMARGGKQFTIPDGYFLGPGGENGKGQIGATMHQTDWMFFEAAFYGYLRPIGDEERAQAREDFAHWGVEAIVLPDQITGSHTTLFRSAVEITAVDLLGPPERVDDVLLWRIKPGIDPVDAK
jgi:hypothetical protein